MKCTVLLGTAAYVSGSQIEGMLASIEAYLHYFEEMVTSIDPDAEEDNIWATLIFAGKQANILFQGTLASKFKKAWNAVPEDTEITFALVRKVSSEKNKEPHYVIHCLDAEDGCIVEGAARTDVLQGIQSSPTFH